MKRLAAPQDFPESWPGASEESRTEPILTAELLAYADETGESWGNGDPRDYYILKWRPVLEDDSWHAGFNWAALLFGLNWCFWRKLYVVGISLTFAQLLVAAVVSLLFVAISGTEDPNHIALAALPWASVLLLQSCFAAVANNLYLRRTLRAIEAVRGSTPELEARISSLRKRGGTSGLALALSIVVVLSWRLYGLLAVA